LSVKVRLKRFGTKNRQQYRIVIADAKMPRDGRFIEEIGFYNPIPVDEEIEIKQDRLDYWLSQGAQVTGTVKSLLKRVSKKKQPSA